MTRSNKRGFRRVSMDNPGYPTSPDSPADPGVVTLDRQVPRRRSSLLRGGRKAALAGALMACVSGLGVFGGCMPMPRAALDQMQTPPAQQVVTKDGGATQQVAAEPDGGSVLMVVPTPGES